MDFSFPCLSLFAFGKAFRQFLAGVVPSGPASQACMAHTPTRLASLARLHPLQINYHTCKFKVILLNSVLCIVTNKDFAVDNNENREYK